MPVRPIKAAGKAPKNNKLRKSKKTTHRGGADSNKPVRTYYNPNTGTTYTRPSYSGIEDSNMTEQTGGFESVKPEHPNMPKHVGGAIYSFNLDDKIGGLPANISLNGTQDGDCPSSGAFDLGFTNYGLTKSNSVTTGGAYMKKQKSAKKSKKNKLSRKSKNSRKHKKTKSYKHKK
jgi:hypothetical protein